MTKKCSCCLRKREGQLTRIGKPMKKIFKDLIHDFELPDGKICIACHENLVTFSTFKAKITRKHKKRIKNDFQQVIIKCEPMEVAPTVQMFTQFDVLPRGLTIKTEVDNQAYDVIPAVTSEPESLKTSIVEAILNTQYESDSNGAVDDWNCDDFPPLEQESNSLKKKVKKVRSKKYSKRVVKSLPRMPRMKGQKYECDLCGLEINHKSKLKTHFIRGHQISRKEVIPCSFCTKKFYNRASIIKHINRYHADRNEFHCSHCYSLFSTMELLREHRVMVHIKAQMGSKKEEYLKKKTSSADKVLCPQCGTIITKSCLKAHISRVHLKEKKVGCTECGKRFQTKHYLRNHIATHHSGGAKPYQCDLCSQCYPTKHSIYKHLQFVHEDKKKVSKAKCEFCWKSFIMPSRLARHMKQMHVPGEEDDGFRANPETNMFHCTFCQRQFVNKTICKHHIKKFHR